MSTLPRSISASLRALGAAALLPLVVGGSCSGRRPDTTPEPVAIREAEMPAPDLRLLLITDLAGYLEPCGCTSRPLGGIDRLAARVAELDDEELPVAFVAAGDLLFHELHHGVDVEGADDQERWKAETLVGIFERLGLDAAAPGLRDFEMGTETYRALAEAASFPMVGAGYAVVGADAALRPGVVVRAGSARVGVVGVGYLLDPAGHPPRGLATSGDPLVGARAEIARLRQEGVDLVVALARGDRRFGAQVGRELEADVVVLGGLDEPDARPPTVVGGAVIVHAGRQGQGVVALDLWQRGDGEWTDVSAWTRRARRRQLEEEATRLEDRIEAWEREGSSADDLAAQRARLERLRREAHDLAVAPQPEGPAFRAVYHELGPEAPRDREVAGLVDAYDRRVNDHNREVFADLRPPPVPEGQPRYVGSAACAGCHASEDRWWQGTPHGHAYATLEDQFKNYNLSCVGCHVTGYQEPGGSTVTHVEGLRNVGCEVCHGPGSDHVAASTAATIQREAPEALCTACHNEEHSDTFDYETYMRAIVVPGHGRPVGGDG